MVAASRYRLQRVIPSGRASGRSHKAAPWNGLGNSSPSTSVLVTSCLGPVAVCPSTRCGLDPPGSFHRDVCNFNKPYYEIA